MHLKKQVLTVYAEEFGNQEQLYSYQGDNKSLEIILKAREETGLPIDIEVMDSEQLKLALEAKVDVLQVGTRNALNYSLLKEIGNLSAGSNASVLLKSVAVMLLRLMNLLQRLNTLWLKATQMLCFVLEERHQH